MRPALTVTFAVAIVLLSACSDPPASQTITVNVGDAGGDATIDADVSVPPAPLPESALGATLAGGQAESDDFRLRFAISAPVGPVEQPRSDKVRLEAWMVTLPRAVTASETLEVTTEVADE